MSESHAPRHGLEAFLGSAPTAEDAGVSIAVRSDVGFLNLRGDPRDSAFVDAADRILGQALPVEPNTFTAGQHRAYWLGPDEWLLVTAGGRAGEIAAGLEAALAEMHAAINDVSGGNVALRLGGSGARHVLAKGCTLDLHPDTFGVSSCAQSGLAKASVLLGLVDDSPMFEIVVRRSFSDYLCRWLAHSARTDGVRFESG